MFIRAFGHNPTMKCTKRYKGFVQRYASYNPRDVVVLCAWHHCEIHLLYDEIVLMDKRLNLTSSLKEYTWIQADALMKQLRKLCYQWETEITSGRDPDDCAPGKRYPTIKLRGPRKKRKRKRKRKK